MNDNKSTVMNNAAVQQLRAWGREPFWAYYSELQYRHVDKKLLIEEYIGTPDGTLPEDYKCPLCGAGAEYFREEA